MRVVIYIRQGAGFVHQSEWLNAFAEGVRKDGHQVIIQRGYNYFPGHVAVMWGANPIGDAVRKKVVAAGGDYIELERAYLGNQVGHASAGINGHGGLAQHVPGDMPGDRFEKLEFPLLPWSAKGKLHLIIGQVSSDASLAGVRIDKWYNQMVEDIRANMKTKGKNAEQISFRAHPIYADRGGVAPRPNGILGIAGKLCDILEKAKCVYTYSSTVGVDAIMAGRPVYAESEMSMVRQFSGITKEPDREQWAWNLAYSQWLLEEYSDGTAWGHLKQIIDANRRDRAGLSSEADTSQGVAK